MSNILNLFEKLINCELRSSEDNIKLSKFAQSISDVDIEVLQQTTEYANHHNRLHDPLIYMILEKFEFIKSEKDFRLFDIYLHIHLDGQSVDLSNFVQAINMFGIPTIKSMRILHIMYENEIRKVTTQLRNEKHC